MPKSLSLAAPFAIRMLLGFTSRWTIPWPCASTSASAVWPSSVAASVASSGPVGPDALAERLAVDVLHHQPADVVLVDEVEDRDHVRVVQRGGQAGLALGPLDLGVVGAGDHADALHRDLPAEHLVEREVHRPGATAPDLSLEPVPACDHVPSFLRPRPRLVRRPPARPHPKEPT